MSTEVTNDNISTEEQASPDSTSQSSPPQATNDNAPSDTSTNDAGNQADQPPHLRTPDEAKSLSLTPPKSVALNTQVPPTTGDAEAEAHPDTYRKLREEKAHWARQTNDLKRQYEDTRKQLATFQQEREKQTQLAQQQKLALHDPRHPDHSSKFQPTLAKADIVRSQLARLNTSRPPDGLTPEQGQAWKESQREAIMGTLSEDEQVALEQFQNHNAAFQRKMAINPQQALTEFVQPMLEQFFQQKNNEQRAAQEVDQDLNDPIAGPIIKEMQGDMLEAINRLGGTDEAYEFVKHQAVTYAKNKAYSDAVVQENVRLKQQLQEMGIKVGTAQTQQQLAKGKASITRDVVPRATKSPYDVASDWAVKNRVSKGSPQFFQHLREIEAEQASR